MKLYNTLTRRLEEFRPLEPGRVRMYTCGPTVYRYVHIGNLRTFTMADWLRRALTYLGYEVFHVKNITDVGHMRVEMLDRGEDKLIAQARREGKTSAEIAAHYTEAFLQDERRMNILPAHVFPRATEHIPEMIEIVQGLLARGLAYEVNGNVYFDVSRFPRYGQLSGNQLASLLEGVREAAAPDKRSPEDFALWKLAEPGRDLAWDSPWGRGFPGWHIECSAMAMKYLGPRFDIHTGGVDNIFPHHEDEIAQSEGYTGERFVNYWVHAQHLLADGLKMAKSTGNAYTLADLDARGFDPMDLRYLFATAHYRTRLNFTFTALKAAQTGRRRLRMAIRALAEAAGLDGPPPALTVQDTPWQRAFLAAITADLNIPRALAVVWDLARRAGHALPPAERLALILDFARVLGLDLAQCLASATSEDERRATLATLPASVAALVTEREAARCAGRFAAADRLRAAIAAAGYHVRDTRHGPWVVPRAPDEGLLTISSPNDIPDRTLEPDRYDFSVSLLARNSRADLERCLRSIVAYPPRGSLELVLLDNGSTDETLDYLRALAREGRLRSADGSRDIPLQVIFADHDLGFAAGRRATMRASLGRIIVWLDTSIELVGDIWDRLAEALADPEIGVVGPYGLITRDLREFYDAPGPDVDAVQGYLLAFRRALVPEVGWLDDKYRFYRMADVHYSFMFKTAGYRVVALPELAPSLVQHPHREWYSLTPEEQATKSKKNYDLFRARWHHGQSLLTVNFTPGQRWLGHDHAHHLGYRAHTWQELPRPDEAHVHEHHHWPDHSHTHAHVHARR